MPRRKRFILNQPQSFGDKGDAFAAEMEATPIVVDLDIHRIAQPIAVALPEIIGDSIKAITARPTSRTLEQRGEARKAYDRGEQWAVERFPQGRPDPTSQQLFINSGYLAENLGLEKTRKGWDITYPPLRFSGPDWTAARVSRVESLLFTHVDVLANSSKFGAKKKFKRAVNQSYRRMITVRPMTKKAVR